MSAPSPRPPVTEIRFDASQVSGDPLIGHRETYFAEAGGYRPTPVYARDRLTAGTTLQGPALITEAETTCVIGPSATVTPDTFGNLIMQLQGTT